MNVLIGVLEGTLCGATMISQNDLRQVTGNSAPMLKTLGYPALPHEALWVGDKVEHESGRIKVAASYWSLHAYPHFV